MGNPHDAGNSVLKGKRVLICEDEGITIMLFARALKAAGLAVIGKARTGQEAVKLGLELAPDLILMDLTLNDGVNGIEAARRILEVHPKTLIIGISGVTVDTVIQQGLDAGMCGFIPKPIDASHLRQEIQGLLERLAPEE